MFPSVVVVFYRYYVQMPGQTPRIQNHGTRKIVVASCYGYGIVLPPKIADMRTDVMYVQMRIFSFQPGIQRIGIVPAKPLALDAEIDEKIVYVRRAMS